MCSVKGCLVGFCYVLFDIHTFRDDLIAMQVTMGLRKDQIHISVNRHAFTSCVSAESARTGSTIVQKRMRFRIDLGV